MEIRINEAPRTIKNEHDDDGTGLQRIITYLISRNVIERKNVVGRATKNVRIE